MKFNHRVSMTAESFDLSKMNVSEEDMKVIEKASFPKYIKSGDVAMKRTNRRPTNGIYVDKENVQLEDVSYLTVSRHIANGIIAGQSTIGRTPEETKMKEAYVEGMLKSKVFKTEFIDAVAIKEELEDFLLKFGNPVPTASMEAPKEKEEPVEKLEVTEVIKKVIARTISDEQKEEIKTLFEGGSMSSDEIADHLSIAKKTVKDFIKTLNKPKNG